MNAARRTSTLALALPAVLFCPRECSADPLTLRAPIPGRVVSATFGTPEQAITAKSVVSSRIPMFPTWAVKPGGSSMTTH